MGAFSRERNRPTCRSCSPQNSSWRSTSRTAKTLGLTVPPTMLATDDKARGDGSLRSQGRPAERSDRRLGARRRGTRRDPQTARRANQQIHVQPFLEKYSAFPVGQIISTSSPRLVPRGAARDRHERGAGRGGRDSVGTHSGRRAGLRVRERVTARRRTAMLRTAKSCGPDAPMLASSSQEANASWKRRWQQSRSPGRAGYKS